LKYNYGEEGNYDDRRFEGPAKVKESKSETALLWEIEIGR